VVGDDGKINISGEPVRKGTPKFAHLPAPLDALLRQNGLLVEAHLLDLTLGSGMAPFDGLVFYTDGVLQKVARDRAS
jgi:hypothetical protein